MTNPFSQADHAVRMEWGPVGAAAATAPNGIAVVVDVLSFSTTVSVAMDVGVTVYPYRWQDDSAAELARRHGATLAVGRPEARRSPGSVSLSPYELCRARGLRRLVLPSPNGSSICFGLAASGATVVAAGLRNRAAVAAWLHPQLAEPASCVTVVVAGERWPDGTLRPAVEDLWGAGAVIAALQDLGAGDLSPEAQTAAAAFRAVEPSLPSMLRDSASGRELVEAGFPEDVEVSAEIDTSACVPVLRDGRFVDLAV